MPLQISKNPQYSRINKVPITNDNRTNDSKSATNYAVELPYGQELQNVFSIEIAGYNFPAAFTPSFHAENISKGIKGTNKLDFSLENTDVTPLPTVFTLTWPTTNMVYENTNSDRINYVIQLQKRLRSLISADPVWANEIRVSVLIDSPKENLYPDKDREPGIASWEYYDT